MSIKSIGVDIEEISRFSSHEFHDNESFYKKIFNQDEIKYCLNTSNPYEHFTARFCAKEAAIKALNDKKIRLSDIKIKIENESPTLVLPNGIKGLVSLSHTKKYAVAFVMILE